MSFASKKYDQRALLPIRSRGVVEQADVNKYAAMDRYKYFRKNPAKLFVLLDFAYT